MRLQLLGTGGYHPNERRHTACLLVPELGLAFDAGSSAFRVASRLQSTELDLFLTHAHLDHIMGLTFLLVPMMKGEITHCRIHAEPHVHDVVQRHLFDESIFPVLPPFEFVPLAERTEVGSGRAVVTHCPLRHPGGSRGFVVEIKDQNQPPLSGTALAAGSSQQQPAASAVPLTMSCRLQKKRLAYITDTVADGSYVEFIRGADVLIHECNFPDEMSQWCEQTGHSHTSAVARLAKEAGVGRLYLTHIDPQRPDDDPIGLAIARAIFPQTTLAEDLMEIEF